MSLVKHSSHLAAISESAAAEFRGFEQMLRSQGLLGPKVTAQVLPTAAPEISDDDLERARQLFDISVLPVVLVVGSHEPRKNHLVVLEAAEAMWRSGEQFDLIFAGGSAWGGPGFGDYVKALAVEGFPLRVYERVAEQSLWALYRLADFSVFPSLLEGYGLPIAESLASGTPVITSNHGSMAEIAEGGGALVVDPRDSAELAKAMTSLLTDKGLRNRLADEARARVFPTWDQYSESLWLDLIGSDPK
jgi:glycosyltransferase involved in cell wall biosynthesis